MPPVIDEEAFALPVNHNRRPGCAVPDIQQPPIFLFYGLGVHRQLEIQPAQIDVHSSGSIPSACGLTHIERSSAIMTVIAGTLMMNSG